MGENNGTNSNNLFDSQIVMTFKELLSVASFLIIIGGGIYGFHDMKSDLKKISEDSESHQNKLQDLGGKINLITNDVNHIKEDISEIKSKLNE